jgi:DNA (cytosine-5)-methyltransferase 1
MLTAVDYFCGMGGSSSGLTEAGFEIKVAANHWARAIETHSANHPNTEHLCADLQQVDVRYLPSADLLWASPICTELSPAGGRKRRRAPDQTSLWEEYGHVPSEAFERTRVTFWEVLRYAEVHNPPMVLVENVAEAADWHLLPTWLHGWTTLGYTVQIICVSAAHVHDEHNAPAPQWRDRIYFGISRNDVPVPDFAVRPPAWCEKCGHDVESVQWWKPRTRQILGQPVGKYGVQYLYICPEADHGPVEPYVAPASVAIDWTDLGTRIGDRESLGMRKLGAATMRRIEHGLRLIGDPALIAAGGNVWDRASAATATGRGKTKLPENYLRAWPIGESPTPAQVTAIQNGIAMSEKFVMSVNHDGHGRHFDPDLRPMPSGTTKRGEGLVMAEPFVTMLRRNGKTIPVSEPTQTFSAGGFHHGLTVPPGAFIAKQYGGRLRDEHAVKPISDPLAAAVAQGAPTLVIPYRKGSKPYRSHTDALSTVATHDQHGVLAVEQLAVEDCYFRMLNPREAANAQRFWASYVIHGNKGEQQMQAGNAVAVNVAHHLGKRAAVALNGRAA